MILQSTPFSSPWTRGAIIFLMCNSLSLFLIWMVFDIAGKAQNFTGPLWLIVAGVSLLLYVLGVCFEVVRLRYATLILGVFVALPGLIVCSTPLFLLAELAKIEDESKKIIWLFYFFLLFAWCFFEGKKIIYLEKKHDYLRSNVRVKGFIGFFYPDFSGVLSDEGSSAPFTKTKMLSIITPIAFLGYPMQRLLAEAGGSIGVFGFLAVLTIPMSVYLAGKISAGYFLWIYLVGKFEVENNVKIFLRYPPHKFS